MKTVPCVVAGCYKRSTERSRCDEHQLPAFQSGRKERLPDDWRSLSSFIMFRDRGICHVCGEPGADGVDHLIVGDNHNPENLAPIHHHVPPHCHRFKTSQEGQEAQRLAHPADWGTYWMKEYRRRKEDPNTRAPF